MRGSLCAGEKERELLRMTQTSNKNFGVRNSPGSVSLVLSFGFFCHSLFVVDFPLDGQLEIDPTLFFFYYFNGKNESPGEK